MSNDIKWADNASESLRQLVADKCLQIHGGYGYMEGFAIERFYRDLRIMPVYEGTSEVQLMVISSAIMNK